MDNDNINDYIPSILNPRAVRKEQYFSLTQNSFTSRSSLSLRRPNCLKLVKPLKTINTNINVQRSQQVTRNVIKKNKNGSHSQILSSQKNLVKHKNKENSPNVLNYRTEKVPKDLIAKQVADEVDDDSLDFSFLENVIFTDGTQKFTKDLSNRQLVADDSLEDLVPKKHAKSAAICSNSCNIGSEDIDDEVIKLIDTIVLSGSGCEKSLFGSSAAELQEPNTGSLSTVLYDISDRPTVRVSFEVSESSTVDVNAKNGDIKRFRVTHNDNTTDVYCELTETSQLSAETMAETEVDNNMNEISVNPLKRSAVTVGLEIKKKKLTEDDNVENSKVLILNTNAVEKISHVIVQPPNYKFVKRNISHKSKYKNDKPTRNGNTTGARLKQVNIERFFRQGTDATIDVSEKLGTVDNDASKEMSKNLGVIDAVKCDRLRSARALRELDVAKSPRREDSNESPQSARQHSKRDIKTSSSATPPPRSRNESTSAHTPRKNVESIHFTLPVKSKSNKTPLSPRNIPHHKIVAGTHFAVDAFSYGEIPNVKHYFLTHFHSDHYSGLKKSFSKLLFCSKITADLCISRLGVNPKNIRVINVDEVLRIEGVEVATVDANHCPGALMFVFTLANGKTLLHTGDFRACPQMESYPVFWNRDIHTVYLDTTYCNPRYDFPTQDQSLEAALYILRQKKMALEKAGKKFSSVLIVCGTYTIGKEKFFMGMSRRVGCSVWACPEKERVLQTVEGRSFSHEKAEACQLHVVPMRDLTHEKLRSYLDSLQGGFAEVVAFKPSGWENGKNSSVEKNSVTIHGIPYSEHSSFSELIRFIKFLKPKLVVPTVDISGGVKAVQKYFPCPLVYKDDFHCQTKVTDYFSIHSRQQVPAVT